MTARVTVTLEEGQSYLTFTEDGQVVIHLPDIPEELIGTDADMANAGAILCSAMGCRIAKDPEWGNELIDWYFEKLEEYHEEVFGDKVSEEE